MLFFAGSENVKRTTESYFFHSPEHSTAPYTAPQNAALRRAALHHTTLLHYSPAVKGEGMPAVVRVSCKSTDLCKNTPGIRRMRPPPPGGAESRVTWEQGEKA